MCCIFYTRFLRYLVYTEEQFKPRPVLYTKKTKSLQATAYQHNSIVSCRQGAVRIFAEVLGTQTTVGSQSRVPTSQWSSCSADTWVLYVHGPTVPSQTQIILWSKCATVPPEINILQFRTASAPPSRELPDGCNGCRQGWGWGCRGRLSWGWGVRKCWGGFLTIKNFNFRYHPTTAPFRNKSILNHRPVTAPTKKQ